MTCYSFAKYILPLLSVSSLFAGKATSGGIAAPVFGSHMVLQRDMPVPVWGSAKPNRKITVKFAGQEKSTVSDSKGSWSIKLAPMKVSKKGQVMLIVSGEGTEAKTTMFDDVLIGEVWFCSGQSNMEWTLKKFKKDKVIAAADHPLLRYNKSGWQVCSPEVAANFSATAYFFGLNLLNDLKVPVGLINRSAGGTPIEYWMSKEALFKIPYAREMAQRVNKPDFIQAVKEYNQKRSAYNKAVKAWRQERAKGNKSLARPKPPASLAFYSMAEIYRTGRPGRLYRQLVKPVMPYAIRGIIWYQGERNGWRDYSAQAYRDQLAALIRSWRNEWGEGNIPFLYVQLPNFNAKLWPVMRESMLECLKVDNTGMAVSIDIGSRKTIHPPNKEAVGKRLALLAMKKVYGKDVVGESPLLGAMKIEQDKVILSFKTSAAVSY